MYAHTHTHTHKEKIHVCSPQARMLQPYILTYKYTSLYLYIDACHAYKSVISMYLHVHNRRASIEEFL